MVIMLVAAYSQGLSVRLVLVRKGMTAGRTHPFENCSPQKAPRRKGQGNGSLLPQVHAFDDDERTVPLSSHQVQPLCGALCPRSLWRMDLCIYSVWLVCVPRHGPAVAPR